YVDDGSVEPGTDLRCDHAKYRDCGPLPNVATASRLDFTTARSAAGRPAVATTRELSIQTPVSLYGLKLTIRGGSIASRRASPSRLRARTSTTMANPGNAVIHGLSRT